MGGKDGDDAGWYRGENGSSLGGLEWHCDGI